MKNSNVAILVTIVVCAIFAGCSVSHVEDPLISPNTMGAERSSLTNSSGLVKTVFYPYETVFLTLDGLSASWETVVEVVRLQDKKIVRRLVVVTDINGRLLNVPVWYELGTNMDGTIISYEHGDYVIHIQQANLKQAWFKASIPFTVRDVKGGSPMVWATRVDGSFAQAAAQKGGEACVRGLNFTPGSQVRIYVVPDQEAFTSGEVFNDQTETVEQVVVAGDGSLPNTIVWNSAQIGSYDIVVDQAPFGEYGAGDAFSDGLIAGLVVQSDASTADIIADIACDADGFHGDAFICDDIIYGQVTPEQRPMNVAEMAVVFVALHKDRWMAGDRLIGIETVHCLINPLTGALAHTVLRGKISLEDNSPLNLWPGEYDIIIDANRNSKYDPGIDILDGGPQAGFTISCESVTPAPKLIVCADSDILDQKSTKTWIHALVLDKNNQPIPGINVSFKSMQAWCRIDPEGKTTDASGVLSALVWDIGIWGQILTIKVEAVVNGVLLVEYLKISKQIPFVHNSGVIIGG